MLVSVKDEPQLNTKKFTFHSRIKSTKVGWAAPPQHDQSGPILLSSLGLAFLG